jgi:hypothetical protein
MSTPELALCLKDPLAIESVSRVLTAASSGAELHRGNHLDLVLDSVDPQALRLLVVDSNFAEPEMLASVCEAYPHVKIVVLTDALEEQQLQIAMGSPRLVGFVARRQGVIRAWELVYLVRRVLSPEQPVPGSHELLNWGASSVTFRPKNTKERDSTVEGVEVVAMRFGMSSRMAKMAAEASHELLMNAMYDAPVDKRGRPRYADKRQSAISLQEHEIPTLRVTVDGLHIALDITDPFGRLSRERWFASLLRGKSGLDAADPTRALDESEGGAGLGLHNLFSSAAILRAEVVPARQTTVTWILDLSIERRTQRQMPRSLYYVEAR